MGNIKTQNTNIRKNPVQSKILKESNDNNCSLLELFGVVWGLHKVYIFMFLKGKYL